MIRRGFTNAPGTSGAQTIRRLPFVSTGLADEAYVPRSARHWRGQGSSPCERPPDCTLDANNRPTANGHALHEPSPRIVVVRGIVLGRPVVPHGDGVWRPVKPELIFRNERLVE